MAKFLDYDILKILVNKLTALISKAQERADKAYNKVDFIDGDYLSIQGGETEINAWYRIGDENPTYIDNSSVSTQYFKQLGYEDNHNYVVGTDGVPKPIGRENGVAYTSICPLDNDGNIPTEFLSNVKGTIPITDSINLTTETTLSLAAKYAKVANNGLNFYVIADSSGKLPSSETRININSSITSLVGAEGANVGDLFVVGKLDLKPVYKIIPLNDAKAENSSYKGTQGVVTPWDKAQINKVPNMESAISAAKNNLPTYSESNMNNALKTGFYPWCTLGRPSGSTGAYTLVTLASTTADSSGYTTIEQTAYGRQGELGKIYKRIIFKPSSGDTEYGDWVDISRAEWEGDTTLGYHYQIADVDYVETNEYDKDKIIVIPFTFKTDTSKYKKIMEIVGRVTVTYKSGNTTNNSTYPLSSFNYQILKVDGGYDLSTSCKVYINLGKTIKQRIPTTDTDEEVPFIVSEMNYFKLGYYRQ